MKALRTYRATAWRTVEAAIALAFLHVTWVVAWSLVNLFEGVGTWN